MVWDTKVCALRIPIQVLTLTCTCVLCGANAEKIGEVEHGTLEQGSRYLSCVEPFCQTLLNTNINWCFLASPPYLRPCSRTNTQLQDPPEQGAMPLWQLALAPSQLVFKLELVRPLSGCQI